MNFKEKYNYWVNSVDINNEIKKELKAIQGNEKEVEDRFYKSLDFGTGGLRGILGAGTNRMNIYTVRKATQGLAQYLNEIVHDEKSVVIAYDSRHKSKEFAIEAALVLAKNNIKTYVFESITPTPILSYAIRDLKTSAGIVITASHNPKEYNGYKVYNSDGGQITDLMAQSITDKIEKIQDELAIDILGQSEAEGKGLLVWLDDKILLSYIEKSKRLVLNKEAIAKVSDSFKVIYTPLHGTGYKPVKMLLQEAGFKNIVEVEEQIIPDPDFPTVKYPNPEEHAAFELALKVAENIHADIAMATDPDADRAGVAVRDNRNQFIILSGNQLGALMIDYILHMRSLKNNIPQNASIVKTIVTSSLGVKIAEKYNVGYIDVLTGFKYIGEKIKEFEENNTHTFIFGYEESYGYLIGDYVRDKDAVQACLLAAEMAAYYRSIGITLYERLTQLFEEFGYYKEDLVSFNLKGIEGQKRIKRILESIREQKIKSVNHLKVKVIKDYLACVEENILENKKEIISHMPKSNVIHYTLEDESWFCIRPSGTEPKLKIYFSVVGETAHEAETKLNAMKNNVLRLIERIN